MNRLYLLPAGQCGVDSSAFNTNLQAGEHTLVPIWSYLIETKDGPILVDTGMSSACAADPHAYFGADDDGSLVPRMTADDTIVPILRRAGYAPSDMLCVLSTHWHFDHAGGNRAFPNTPILVQRAEYEAAQTAPGYFDDCRDLSLRYQILDGDYTVAPGVQLIFTPGHAAGHQSVLVETATGPILLAIDAAYTRANFEDGVPFAAMDPQLAAQSVARLHDVAQTSGAQVFFGHDPVQGAAWHAHPAHY